jgi:hypothetical protein
MDHRVRKLADGFDDYVRVFGASERFTGPSGYFHRKTLALRAQQDIASLLKDDAFFDSLYATLTAWGMHRMGPGNTRLRDLAETRASMRSCTRSVSLPSPHRLSPSGASRSRRTAPESRPRHLRGGRDDLRPPTSDACACMASSNGCRVAIAIGSPRPARRSPCSTRASTPGLFAPRVRCSPSRRFGPSAPSIVSTPRSPNSWRR